MPTVQTSIDTNNYQNYEISQNSDFSSLFDNVSPINLNYNQHSTPSSYVNFTVYVRAKSGYTIENAPTLKVFDSDYESTTVTAVKNGDSWRMTFYKGKYLTLRSATITFTTTKSKTIVEFPIKYTNNLEGFETVNLPTTGKTDETILFSVKLKDGYTVETTPQIYINYETTSLQHELEKNYSSGNYEYSYTTSSETITEMNVSLDGIATGKEYNLHYNTDNLIGFSFTEKPTNGVINGVTSFSIKINDNFEVQNLPTAKIEYNGNSENVTLNLSNNIYTGQFIIKDDSVEDVNITLDGLAVTTEFSVTYDNSNLQGFTINSEPTTAIKNNDFTVTISQDKYTDKITLEPKIEVYENNSLLNTVTMVANTSEKGQFNYTFNFNRIIPNLKLVLFGISELPKTFEVSYNTDGLKGFSLQDSPTVFNSYKNNTISIVLSDGFENITKTPYISISSDNKNNWFYGEGTPIENGYKWDITPELRGDSYINTVITITGTAVPTTENLNDFPYLNVYIVNRNTLNELITSRFFDIVGGEQGGYNYKDINDFIIELFTPYYDVEQGEESNIQIGFRDTDIATNLIDEHFKTIESNVLHVDEIYNNILDYTETHIILYIPFVGLIEIEPYLIMNKDVQVVYKIEQSTGDSDCYILANGIPVHYEKCSIKRELGTTANDNNTLKITQSINNKNYFDLTAKIIINYKKSFGSFDTTNTTDIFDNLSNVTGYCKADIYNLIIDENYITQNEIDSIKNLLTQGVII